MNRHRPLRSMCVWTMAASLALAASPLGAAGRRTVCIPVGPPVSLFDGRTLDGWVTYQGEPVTQTWDVQDGALHCAAGRGISILSDREYGDFVLTFRWKIAPGGNSGLKYRVRRYGNTWLGLEYQLLDDAGQNTSRPKGSTASIYDIYEPNEACVRGRPAGEWNTAKIVVCGNLIQHWLNGQLVVQADTSSREWAERIEQSKFRDREGFGANPTGRILLQSHGSEAWFRDICLQPLARRCASPARLAARRAWFPRLRRALAARRR